MSADKIYEIKQNITDHAHITPETYQSMYQRSIDEPEAFWAEQAELFLDWSAPWKKVMDFDYPKGYIRWFEGGKLNVSYNCLDRHLDTRGEQTAIIWEGDNPEQDKNISYRELHKLHRYSRCPRSRMGMASRHGPTGSSMSAHTPFVPPEKPYTGCSRSGLFTRIRPT